MPLKEHVNILRLEQAVTEYTAIGTTYLVSREEDSEGNFICYAVTNSKGRVEKTVFDENKADVAIQAAIDNLPTTGKVLLSAGNFYISSPITFKVTPYDVSPYYYWRSRVLEGMGQQATYILIATDLADFALTVTYPDGMGSGFELRNFTIVDKDQRTYNADGILIDEVNSGIIDSVYLAGIAGYGIRMRIGQDIHISDTHVRTCGDAGNSKAAVALHSIDSSTYTNNIRFTRCWIERNYYRMVECDSYPRWCYFVNTKFHGRGSNGSEDYLVYLDGKYHIISSCEFTYAPNSCLYIDGERSKVEGSLILDWGEAAEAYGAELHGTENSLAGNTIAAGQAGIAVLAIGGGPVSDNVIRGVSGYDCIDLRRGTVEGNNVNGGNVGINQDGANKVEILSNTVSGSGGAGIYIRGAAASVAVNGNTVRDCGADGISSVCGDISIIGNTVLDCSGSQGIHSTGQGAIIGNKVVRSNTPINNGADNSTITGNHIDGDIINTGKNVLIQNNPGYLGVGETRTFSKTVNYDDSSPVTVCNVEDGYAVTDVWVEVTTTWDGGANQNLQIGDGGDVDGFLCAQGGTNNAIDLTTTGYYGIEHDLREAYLWDDANAHARTKVYTGSDTIDASITPDGATQGQAIVYVKVTRIGG